MPDGEEAGNVTQDQQLSYWFDKIAVDQAILTPQATSTKITVVLPDYRKKKVAVLIRNPDDGSVFYTKEGYPYYNLQEEEVLVGTKQQAISLPGQEIFNIDLNSTFLNEFDVAALRKAHRLYVDLQLQILKGKDRLEDIHFVYGLMMSIIETAKSRDGKAARLSKTTISEGTTKQSLVEEFRQAEQKKKIGEAMKWQ